MDAGYSRNGADPRVLVGRTCLVGDADADCVPEQIGDGDVLDSDRLQAGAVRPGSDGARDGLRLGGGDGVLPGHVAIDLVGLQSSSARSKGEISSTRCPSAYRRRMFKRPRYGLPPPPVPRIQAPTARLSMSSSVSG